MKVIVIGGGPAGMMCAGTAAQNGNEVTLIEKNEKLGKKLFITGKGRANITNVCNKDVFFSNVINNSKFLMSALHAFDSADTIAFYESLGVPVKIERGERAFPESDKSSDIIKAHIKHLQMNKVDIMLNSEVNSIKIDNGIVNGVTVNNKNFIPADAVVVATGGISYSATGSTGDGYKFGEASNHNIIEPKAALVPIILKECFDMQGLSLKNVQANIINSNGKILYSEFGEMLFTDCGVTGPIILSLSSRINRLDIRDLSLSIDLKPALTIEQLDARIQRDFIENNNKDFVNSLDDLLPRSLISEVILRSDIDPRLKVNQLDRKQRMTLIRILKGLTFKIKAIDNIEAGIITSGGIDVKNIIPKTMESRLVKGLYFIGEVLDVDALTGGFNIQIALSTGYLAGNSIH